MKIFYCGNTKIKITPVFWAVVPVYIPGCLITVNQEIWFDMLWYTGMNGIQLGTPIEL